MFCFRSICYIVNCFSLCQNGTDNFGGTLDLNDAKFDNIFLKNNGR